MVIDLRSDTVTVPSKEMLRQMLAAKVGDDVFGDDETVNNLEKYSANLFGKEAAVFCPSGTMTNQIAIKLHTNSPGEVICEETSHIHLYEGGGIGFNSGLATKLLKGDAGRLTADQIEKAISIDNVHFPETQLVSLENTCNKGGGSIYEIEEIKKIRAVCVANNLKLHLDGARIFNALAVADYSAKDIGRQFDTISICLSKGLGAPIGSLLLGSKEDIYKARRLRKILGGGMRQVGYLAAAAHYALQNNLDRIVEDHHKAKVLGDKLLQLNFVKKVLPVYTNIVIFEIIESISCDDIICQLGEHDIKVVAFGPQQIRLVTHLDFTNEMLEKTIKILQKIKI